MTHKDLLLDWFTRHPSITPMEALSNLGIYRLGARVFDLREAGHDITTHNITPPNGKHVAQYHLKEKEPATC